ncbi:GGDEF domain-containing protein [Algicola sagamiensis]|uniref:GGDEF domain-containing protein n=1 Tax=Algicola sagamiensis TaxID=163869 RepID=UPI00035C1084|nr:GGDEF domain-containing protein [Algicola sagamiensis]
MNAMLAFQTNAQHLTNNALDLPLQRHYPFNYDTFIHQPLLQLLQQLQTTLDIHQLVTIFRNEMTKLFPLSHLFIRTERYEWHKSLDDITLYEEEIMIGDEKNSLGTILYGFSHILSKAQMKQLKLMHQVLFYPLKNALAYSNMQELAMVDPLTGLGNRSQFEKEYAERQDRAARYGQPFSILMLDLDNFKHVNDCYGHTIGDEVLNLFANLLQRALRATDTAFRFGGDEFLVLADTNKESPTECICERILAAANEHPRLKDLDVTVSIGSANWCTHDCGKRLLQRSDDALYTAKYSGKNRYYVS